MLLVGFALMALGVWGWFLAVWVFEVGERRHRACRWWLRWRRRPCYACICEMEREVFGSPDYAHLVAPR